ncbi:MAG: dihydrofolate reductase [Mariprofundales bacterium]
MPNISLIAAVADNAVIGNGNALCWHLPNDMRFFRQTTLNHSVIMGRVTFDSIVSAIGKPLPYRHNIILTRNQNYIADYYNAQNSSNQQNTGSCHTASTVEQALMLAERAAPDINEIMVIGGAQVYAEFLPLAQRLYLTRVHTEIAGDVFFTDYDNTYDNNIWQQQQCISHTADELHAHDFDIVTLVRKNICDSL